MTAETILMKLLAIPETDREAFQKTIATCPPEQLELCLIQMSQHRDEDAYNSSLEDWASTYFPETLGKYAAS